MLPPELATLVDALPERYQPIFGHPAEDGRAVRACRDRLAEIEPVVDALASKLARPVRVLDLGCAQGFFALSLASRGAVVTGIDRLAANIAVCRALAAERPELTVEFVEGDAIAALRAIEKDQYDVILALSVLHHMCHEQGADVIRTLLGRTASRVELVVAEIALCDEPLYWGPSQPADPRDLLRDFPFVHEIGRHPTHLSELARPLIVGSSNWWWLGDMLGRFEAWSHLSRANAEDVHQGTRRYYFSPDRFVKYFRFGGEPAERNREELAREAAFLADPPQGMSVPRFVAAGIERDHGWLVRELLPGRLVSEIIAAGAPLNRPAVVGDVLDALCALEAAGLYHGDVRTWNVVLGDDGRSTLIDYGDITGTAQDCAWPYDLFLSFLLFVREIESREVLRALPTRSVSFAPEHFTGRFRAWVAALWSRPVETWTFTYVRETFRAVVAEADGDSTPQEPALSTGPAWQFAVERYLETVGAHQKQLAEALEREFGERQARERTLDGLTKALNDEQSARRQQTSELAAVRGTLTAVQAERDELRGAVAECSLRLATLSTEVAEAVADADATREARRQMLASQTRLAERLDALLGRLDPLETAVDACVTHSAALTEEVQRQKGEAAHWWRATGELQHELELVYSTWSWRVTAPLRLVRRGLARLHRNPDGPPPAAKLRRATWRFVQTRPRLKTLVAGHLDRYPGTKARIKGWLAGPASPPVEAAAPVPVDESGLGHVAREVFAELKREIGREDPSRTA